MSIAFLAHTINKQEKFLLNVYRDIAESIILKEHFNVIEDFNFKLENDIFTIDLLEIIQTEPDRDFFIDLVVEQENIYLKFLVKGDIHVRYITQDKTILTKILKIYNEDNAA